MDATTDKTSQEDMFEYLRRETGAMYISDLRYSPYRERAIRMIAQCDASRYELDDWNDAVTYLLYHAGCETPNEARQLFITATMYLL